MKHFNFSRAVFQSRMGRRIFFMFAVCSLVPILLLSALSYYHVRQQLREQSLSRLQQMTKSTAMSILERLAFFEAEMRLWTQELKPDLVAAQIAELSINQTEDAPRFASLIYQSHDGRRLKLAGDMPTLPGAVQSAIDHLTQEKAVLIADSTQNMHARIFMLMAVADVGQPAGALIGELNTATLWGIGQNYNLPPMTELVVLSQDGRVLISSIPINAELRRRANPATRDNTSRQFAWQDQKVTFLASYWDLFLKSRYASDPWIVILSQARPDILQVLQRFRFNFPLALLLVLWIILLLSVNLIRRSLVPLQKLEEAAQGVMRGDLHRQVDLKSGDEFEDLAQAFNTMTANLARRFNEVSTIADIGRAAIAESGIEGLTRKVLEIIARRLDFDWGFIWLSPRELGGDCTSLAFGLKRQELVPDKIVPVTDTDALEPMLTKIAKEPQLTVYLDLKASSPACPTVTREFLLASGAVSMIAVPVLYEQRLLGLLATGTRTPLKDRDENGEALLTALAAQTATRLGNLISFRKLAESEARFRQVFDHAGAGMALLDLEGRFQATNQYLQKLLGYSGTELVGIVFNALSDPEDRDIGINGPTAMLSGKRRFSQYQKRFRTKHGNTVWALVSTSLLRNPDDKPLYFICHVSDLTPQKAAEEEKQALEGQLRQAQKMEAIGTLAGGIAHDFNNILSGMVGYADLALMARSDQGKITEYVSQIRQAAYRATDLVRQILTFSRQTEQTKQRLRIGTIVKECLKLIRASLPSSIEIHQHIDDAALSVMADPTQIHQIIMNLCTNAHHAMQDLGGVLEVTVAPITAPEAPGTGPELHSADALLRLTVRDTGCGMTPQTLERIFDPYFTTKEKGKGTGLGLAVVHGIVKDCGGAIRVTSTPGSGTTCEIDLPASEQDRPEISSVNRAISGGTEHILFVDDEETLVNLGRLMLEKLGYRVTATCDPVQALEFVRAHPQDFDLVVTDLTMPGIKGDRLSREIKGIRADLPILICSGYTGEEEREATMGIVAGFIPKPLSFDRLSHAIRQALD
jgi:PAS domain S-box-containing protein